MIRLSSDRSLFLASLVTALFFFSGRLTSSDEVMMVATAGSIAFHGSLHFPEMFGQTFTGYGIGTPLTGVPFVVLQWVLQLVHLLPPSGEVSLAPLSSAVCFALATTGAAHLARLLDPATDAAVLRGRLAALAVASPLLPASQAFYSEGPTAAAFAWLVVGMWRGWPWRCALAGLLAVLARSVNLPVVLLLGLGAWWGSGSRRSALAACVGAGAGLLVTLAQNQALRGSPFATGYDGSDFTTPLLTGVFGLLASPERGLFVFFPLSAVAIGGILSAPRHAVERVILAASLFIFVFHAVFWTWHAGWTVGPRFLLPVVALLLGPLAVRMAIPGAFHAVLWLWGAFGAGLYAVYHPMDLWNWQWGFHQQENQWLFQPQLSLWLGWPLLQYAHETRCLLGWFLGRAAPVAILLPALVGLLFWPGPIRAREAWTRLGRAGQALALSGPVVLLVLGLARGERGFQLSNGEKLSHALLRLPKGSPAVHFDGLLDLPLNGKYTFRAKMNGTYRVELDGQVLFDQAEAIPQHLPGASIDLKHGLHPLSVDFKPNADEDGLLALFLSWPGEGRYLDLLGGEYTLPDELSPPARVAAQLWRRAPILLAGWLALLLLYLNIRAGNRTSAPAGP